MRADSLNVKNSLSSFRQSQSHDSHASSPPPHQERSTQQVGVPAQELVEKPSALDAALEEERLQELRRINQDLVLVNEMFK